MESKVKTVKEFYMAKKAIERWKSLGLWDEMPDELALKLEQLATYLLSVPFNSNSNIDVLMFPIVIRTFKTYSHLIENIPYAVFYVEVRLEMIKEFEAPGVDAEAVFVDEMSKQLAHLKI